jgi:hypothetical protein
MTREKLCGYLFRVMRRKSANNWLMKCELNPNKFHHFKLLYSLSSQTSQTQQTTISVDSITSGTLVSNLLQKFKDKTFFWRPTTRRKCCRKRPPTFEWTHLTTPRSHLLIRNFIFITIVLFDMLLLSKSEIKKSMAKSRNDRKLCVDGIFCHMPTRLLQSF